MAQNIVRKELRTLTESIQSRGSETGAWRKDVEA